MYYVKRIYLNSTGDAIRIDDIEMKLTITTVDQKNVSSYTRMLTKQNIFDKLGSRVISNIVLDTDSDSYDSTSHEWAEWTTPSITCDMSDLPKVGDTI